jgi:membrane protein implicated in regulation of membrane protease activity
VKEYVDMDFVRIVLSIAAFIIGFYLIVDLVVEGFDFAVLICAVVSFLLAHVLWPEHERKDDDKLYLIDIIELVVQLPYNLVVTILRGIGRIAKDGGDTGLDL